MTPEALVARYAGLRSPNYATYPAAAEFSSALGAREQARWFARLDPADSVSAYLRVPGCRTFCRYCGSHAKMAVRGEVIAHYGRLLAREMEIAGDHLPRSLKIKRLHWGGSPLIMGARGLQSVLDALSARFSFDADLEHTIVLDSSKVTDELASDLVALGVNHVSLGVQHPNSAAQLANARVQSFATVAFAFERFRMAGVRSINVDLVYGSPHQSVASVREAAWRMTELRPQKITFRDFVDFSPSANPRLANASVLPDAASRLAQTRAGREVLARAGYVAIGAEQFAQTDDALATAVMSGGLRRNLQGYTNGDCATVLGFGASAISRFPDGYIQNATDLVSYERAVTTGAMPGVRGYSLTEDDRLRANVIESLMCCFSADLGASRSAFSDEKALLRPLIADGFVTLRDGILRVTEQGRPLVRLVASTFDAFQRNEVEA